MYPTIPTRKRQAKTRAFRESAKRGKLRRLDKTLWNQARRGIASIGIPVTLHRILNKSKITRRFDLVRVRSLPCIFLNYNWVGWVSPYDVKHDRPVGDSNSTLR